MTQPRAWRLAALLACGVLLAGCTSSSRVDDKRRRQLEQVLLQLRDFPPSWRSFPTSDSTGDLLGDVATCTGDTQGAQSVATAHSGEFRRGQQHITSTAVAYPDQETVARFAGALGNARAVHCVAQALRPRVLAVVPDASITGAHFTVQEGGVNVAINYAGKTTGVVSADAEGRPVHVDVDVVFILGNDFYSDITFIGVDTRVSEFIRHVLTDDVAFRAQQT